MRIKRLQNISKRLFHNISLWVLHSRAPLQAKGVSFYKKVRWRMLYDRNPIFITLKDKFSVRPYAESKQVSTTELLYTTDRPESIPFDNLPNNYFIKANYGWQWSILCFNSRYYRFGNGEDLINADGTYIDLDSSPHYELSKLEVIEQCKIWLKNRYSFGEWIYDHISSVIIIESIPKPKGAKPIDEYRMYTFNGKVKAISIGSGIYKKHKKNIFFDLQWKPIPLTFYKDNPPDILPEKPDNLDEIISAAERLGEGIDFVRVDLYDTKDGVILGEMTLYPEGGCLLSPTACPVFNIWLGDQWNSSPLTKRNYVLPARKLSMFQNNY